MGGETHTEIVTAMLGGTIQTVTERNNSQPVSSGGSSGGGGY